MPDFQEPALWCVVRMSLDAQAKDTKIRKYGGFPLLIELLFSVDAGLRIPAAKALANLKTLEANRPLIAELYEERRARHYNLAPTDKKSKDEPKQLRKTKSKRDSMSVSESASPRSSQGELQNLDSPKLAEKLRQQEQTKGSSDINVAELEESPSKLAPVEDEKKDTVALIPDIVLPRRPRKLTSVESTSLISPITSVEEDLPKIYEINQ